MTDYRPPEAVVSALPVLVERHGNALRWQENARLRDGSLQVIVGVSVRRGRLLMRTEHGAAYALSCDELRPMVDGEPVEWPD